MLDNTFYEELGSKLRAFRKIKNMTLKDLAKELNKSASTISKYENGEIAISIDLLVDICQTLNIDIASLLPCTFTDKSSVPTAKYKNYFTDHLFIYWYNKELGKVKEATIENASTSNTSFLYFGSEDEKEYRKSDYIYTGTMTYSDTSTVFLYTNVLPPFDNIFIRLSSLIQKNSPRIGIMSCITSYYQGVTVKILASTTRVPNPESLKEQLIYTPEQIKNLKRTNFFIV